MNPKFNRTVLMSDTDFFDSASAINPFMDSANPIDLPAAKAEHDSIKAALQSAGVTVVNVASPLNCQDGVYAANWALVRGDIAVVARLPGVRQGEEAYAQKTLRDLGKTIVMIPEGLRFSGQGDALPCGNYLLTGSNYRTDPAVHALLAETLGYEVISLQTVPQIDPSGNSVINAVSGWPDSFFYDIDLAISVLRSDLIAWCPEAFMPDSQDKIRALPIERIEVSLEEALQAFACNLVSTGEIVVMSNLAPNFRAAVEAHGLKTITPNITELAKGGGYIRCTTLTLDNL